MTKNKQITSPEILQEITQNIKSGQYFKDSLDWYAVKFLYPVVQRSFLTIVTLISIATSIVAVVILYDIFPLVRRVPLAVSVDDRTDFYSKLRYIGQPEEDPNDSVVRYLTGRYIQMRETYDFNNIKNAVEYVKKYTDSTDYKNYNDYLRTETNPDSPILKYRNHTLRNIEILEVLKVPREEAGITSPGVHRIVASFRATEVGLGVKKTSLWKAKLNVRFSDIVFYKDTKQFSPLDFQVLQYQALPAEGNS